MLTAVANMNKPGLINDNSIFRYVAIFKTVIKMDSSLLEDKMEYNYSKRGTIKI